MLRIPNCLHIQQLPIAMFIAAAFDYAYAGIYGGLS